MKKINIKKLNLKHFNAFHESMRENAFEMVSFSRPKTKEQSKKNFENLLKKQKKKSAIHFCVFKKKEFLGLVSVLNLASNNYNYKINNIEIAYWIRKKYQKRGYAYNACCKLLKILKKMRIQRVQAFCHEKNKASFSLLMKLNFKKKCLLKRYYKKNKKNINAYLFEKII